MAKLKTVRCVSSDELFQKARIKLKQELIADVNESSLLYLTINGNVRFSASFDGVLKEVSMESMVKEFCEEWDDEDMQKVIGVMRRALSILERDYEKHKA